MPAYLIVTAVLHDRSAFLEGYGAAAAKLVGKLGARYRLMRPDGEGLADCRVVVVESPDPL